MKTLIEKLAKFPVMRSEWEGFRTRMHLEGSPLQEMACACFLCGIRKGLQFDGNRRRAFSEETDKIQVTVQSCFKEEEKV